jgi:hypothetical protein
VLPVRRNFSLPPMCYCVLRTWILSAHVGLNLTDPRADIGTLGDLVGLQVAKVAMAARIGRVNYASAPNFPTTDRPNLKHGVLQHALARP